MARAEGETKAQARRDELPRGEREAGPEERRISATLRSVCAQPCAQWRRLPPAADGRGCGRYRQRAATETSGRSPRERRSGEPGRRRRDVVAALSAQRPRPGAGGRMSESETGDGERAWRQRRGAEIAASPTRGRGARQGWAQSAAE